MNLRRLSTLAVAGLLTLAACGDPEDAPAAQAPVQQRTLEDVTSNVPAEAFPAYGSPWYPTPAAEPAFAPYGSPWYPTPAPDTTGTFEDPCLNRPHGVPKPC